MTEHYFQAESAGNHNLQIIIIFFNKSSAVFVGEKMFAGNRLKYCE